MFRALLTEGFLYFNSIAGIGEKVFFQGLIFLVLVSGFLLVRWRKKEWGRWLLVIFIFIDMIISVQLNINATVVDPYSPEPIQHQLKKLPAGFPVPSLNHDMRHTSDTNMRKNISYLWRNLGELYKIPSSSSFSPYKLNSLRIAVRNNTYDPVIGQPLASPLSAPMDHGMGRTIPGKQSSLLPGADTDRRHRSQDLHDLDAYPWPPRTGAAWSIDHCKS